MNKILDLLTSIKFWTIVGAIASGIGLWYILSDKAESSSLGLSTGSYSTAPFPDDKTFVLVNYICAPYLAPVIIPIEIEMANRGTTSLNNASMRWYYTENNDGFNVPLINDMVSPEKKLSVLYMLVDGKYQPFESGDGCYCAQISPKSVAGGLNKVYYPVFADTTLQRHKFDIEVKADETKKEIFHVIMYTIAILPEKGNFDKSLIDATDKKILKLVREESSPGIVNLVVGLWENNGAYAPKLQGDVTIEGIPFVKYIMQHNSIRSLIPQK